MAATKPQLPALKTPLSAGFPSEMRSPCVATPTFIKQEDNGQKTPISPPAAYLDFLSKLSPTVMSPMSATGNSRFSFQFPEKPALTSAPSTDSISTTASSTSFTSTAPAVDTSRPTSPRSTASSRSSSCSSCSSESNRKKRPESISAPKGTVITPPSPFTRPVSARTPRRLHIPQSPYSPGTVRSPLSATSVYSPYSAALSPRDPWDPEKPRTTAVSVRQVVTRTVTHYQRTPIVDPVPPSKKRKVEVEEEAAAPKS